MTTTTKHLIAAGLAGLALLVPTATVAADAKELATAQSSTARCHDVDVALAAGNGVFTDAQGLACIDQPGVGAMGIHHANAGLFGDPSIDAATPEVLVYEPTKNGRLRLVALEYVVLREAWDSTPVSPPSLFGHEFRMVPSGNRFALPDYYELHAWIWKHNPRGTFDDWNKGQLRARVSATPRGRRPLFSAAVRAPFRERHARPARRVLPLCRSGRSCADGVNSAAARRLDHRSLRRAGA
jgi:hypothetical protein